MDGVFWFNTVVVRKLYWNFWTRLDTGVDLFELGYCGVNWIHLPVLNTVSNLLVP
jgi:hypothetical protein